MFDDRLYLRENGIVHIWYNLNGQGVFVVLECQQQQQPPPPVEKAENKKRALSGILRTVILETQI